MSREPLPDKIIPERIDGEDDPDLTIYRRYRGSFRVARNEPLFAIADGLVEKPEAIPVYRAVTTRSQVQLYRDVR